jgi:transposase
MRQTVKSYSEDLRARIVRVVRGRMSTSSAARLFCLSLSFVKCHARIVGRGEALQPRKGGLPPPKTDQTTKKLLEEAVKERPAAAVAKRRRFLRSATRRS